MNTVIYRFPEIALTNEPKVYDNPEDYNWPEDDFQDRLDEIDRLGLPDPTGEQIRAIREDVWKPYAAMLRTCDT